ncbi:MAG: cupin domain-containing protein [Ectothiorhodospiraceae bacterium]|nr:cupin domain-containing protein [Ectothiorhodospiraceae bacterium]
MSQRSGHHFETRRLPTEPDAVAPDGAAVRLLGALGGGSMATFEVAPGQVTRCVQHRRVEEIWLFLSGRGEIWRRQAGHEELTAVESGVCITIPVGTRFQVRAAADAPLVAVAVTMPPWPGDDEAMPAEGPWIATRAPRGDDA